MNKICILGNYYKLGNKIDFHKYNEIWTVNDGFIHYPSTLHFEMHDWVNSQYIPKYYYDLLKYNGEKILLADDKNINNYKLYPLDTIKKNMEEVFTYSMAYILMYAYLKNKKNIYIGGISKQYLINNPTFGFSMYYLLGYLKGKGIKIITQESFFNYDYYGFNLKWNSNCNEENFERK